MTWYSFLFFFFISNLFWVGEAIETNTTFVVDMKVCNCVQTHENRSYEGIFLQCVFIIHYELLFLKIRIQNLTIEHENE